MLLTLIGARSAAHPMPSSILMMDVARNGIDAELKLPLKELQIAVSQDVTTDPQTLVSRLGPWLTSYLLEHIHPRGLDGRPWSVRIRSMSVARGEQAGTGAYDELTVQLWLTPAPGGDVRHFDLYYDAIIHQLVTHKALVSLREDWEGGQTGEGGGMEVGFLGVNPEDNTIPPLPVRLGEGSSWRGFRRMVVLGIDHISNGTDHLLFLLVLLLPAPLIARAGKWSEGGDTKYAAVRLLRIITAFTIGHSVTLLAGALGWLRLPQQPVEILIAFSILVTAVHALRPLFPGRESLVATGFGLVHGLAFAGIVGRLHLSSPRLALSILGFNVGIELMQLFVMLMVVPWLLLLGSYRHYSIVRVGGAIGAGVAAMAWIAERWAGRPNGITAAVEKGASQGKWIVLTIALFAGGSYLMHMRKGK